MTEPGAATWRVLIGRAPARSVALLARLRENGASAVAVSLINISPAADLEPVDAAIGDLAQGKFALVAFTSVNTVRALAERAQSLGARLQVPSSTQVAAVGPATAKALQQQGIAVSVVPPEAGSADALSELIAASPGQLALLPSSDLAAATLPQALARRGYQVRRVVAYRTTPRALPADLQADLVAGRFSAVVLTSPSGVPSIAPFAPPGVALIAIGPVTAAALIAAGRQVAAVAASPTDNEIVAELLRWRAQPGPGK